MQQIRSLGKKDDELEHLIGSIPSAELERDLVRLRQKVQTAESDYLRKEYERSMTEIERQKKSFGDLREQKEVLHLRLRSAVNNMKQMQIDLARMQNLSDTNDTAAMMMLKDRTKELSQYLDDFKSGYNELEQENEGS